MNFDELKKKRYGKYTKITEEDYEIMKAKYEAVQAVKKAKTEAKKKAKRRAKNGGKDSESNDEAPQIALSGTLNADEENGVGNDAAMPQPMQFEFLNNPFTEIVHQPDRNSSRNQLLRLGEAEAKRSEESQDDITKLNRISGVISGLTD